MVRNNKPQPATTDNLSSSENAIPSKPTNIFKRWCLKYKKKKEMNSYPTEESSPDHPVMTEEHMSNLKFKTNNQMTRNRDSD